MNTFHSRQIRSLVGPADLVVAYAENALPVAELVARELGLQYQPVTKNRHGDKRPTVVHETRPSSEVKAEMPDSTGYPRDTSPIQLILPISYCRRSHELQIKNDRPESLEIRWRAAPEGRPQIIPLTPWSLLGERLRSAFSRSDAGRAPDIPRLVNSVARREVIVQIPRQQERCVADLHVVLDESVRLIPFRNDQANLLKHLRSEFPAASLTVSKVRTFDAIDEIAIARPPEGSRVLVAGDLGVFGSECLQWRWREWAASAIADGCQLTALVPCAASRIPRNMHRLFHIVSWQADELAVMGDQTQRSELLRYLFVLTSVCRRVEPGLLRALRCLIPEAKDASLEADYWTSRVLISRHAAAATVNPLIARNYLRPEFERLSPEVRRAVLMQIREWRRNCSPEIWFLELLCLSQASRDLLPTNLDLEDARRCVRVMEHLRHEGDTDQKERFRALQHRSVTHYTSDAYDDPDVGHLIRRARLELRKDLQGLPTGTDPIEVPPGEEVQQYAIDVDDRGVTVRPVRDASASGPLVITISSSNAIFDIAVPESPNQFWKTGKPDFVSDYGTDQYGAWCEFQIPRQYGTGVVTQRMRWIPAGTFLMGSPQGERDRGSGETQHEVKLSHGFWLADTACTQELWEAVTGKTPSRFKGDRLPVEQVSYDEVIKFVRALEKHVPELAPALPTEAQWEYACRADTETPFSFGHTISTHQANFDGNYPYGDSRKGKYREETVDVKSLPSNAWGLYEMHGNVREWCSDWFGEYSAEPQVDPTGPVTGSDRVFRGGSWIDFARFVRSACRNWFDPGYRYSNLGFRLLSSASAEPTKAAEVPFAEQGSEQTRFGEATSSPPLPWKGERAGVRGLVAKTIRVDEGTTAEVELSSLGPIRIRSNLEEVFLERMTKPKWAVAFGRDRFGTYYADFQVSSIEKGAPVRQRMRWIPPGRFRMGSPAGEPGRYDSETQHDVTISSGFWMFDTPCTQALWLAVMAGKNPSHFTDLTRPVAQLNWDHACQFAAKLTSKMPELSFSLPTEAQWEYACRAGTTTAIYTGPLEILGDANAPALDEIAWYGGNCGVDFDLSNGQAVTWLSNKQYDFEKGGTRRVKQKRPNPWGLYDMLGNVWEWCQDWKGDHPSESQVDPIGPEMGSSRVIRGGGWRNGARDVRSACRSWGDPGLRHSDLGFRFLSSASPDRNQRPSK